MTYKWKTVVFASVGFGAAERSAIESFHIVAYSSTSSAVPRSKHVIKTATTKVAIFMLDFNMILAVVITLKL